tara:strand:- start:122 stop:457 length:336 start_codon:yes stop_codon:yes gene_type:complete
MVIKERVQKILNSSGLSASEFSKKINIQRSRLSHILSGRNKPTLEIIVRINKNFPEYTLDWLINGLEPTLPNPVTSDDKNILDKKTSNDSKRKINKIILFYDDETFETFEK